MAENLSEVAAGAVVLAAAVGFAIYAGAASGLSGATGTYPIHASFRAVDGISVGSDVRLAGVKVGTVSSMALNPQTFFADTTISVRKDIELPDDSSIVISSEGLLGGNFVEIRPGGSADNLPPGGKIEDTQGAVSLITLLMKFVGGGSDSGSGSDAASGSDSASGSNSGGGSDVAPDPAPASDVGNAPVSSGGSGTAE